LKVTDIGICAQSLLAQAQADTVMGVTSRGLFLRLVPAWVVFISSETQRGPLVLNCPGQAKALGQIAAGESASVVPGRISFPASGVVINTRQATPWQAPSLPSGLLSPEGRREKLRLVAGLLHARQPASPLLGLLPLLVNTAQPLPPPHAFAAQIDALRRAFVDRQNEGIISALGGFLGMGGGLTPSGDDLVMGCILALSRWGGCLAPELQVAAIALPLLPLAYQQTTTLSANLIECASQGQADERLLLALDGILSDDPDPPTCAAALAAWGNTSGHDALVGMAAVILG
jgi:hypothetical protein